MNENAFYRVYGQAVPLDEVVAGLYRTRSTNPRAAVQRGVTDNYFRSVDLFAKPMRKAAKASDTVGRNENQD